MTGRARPTRARNPAARAEFVDPLTGQRVPTRVVPALTTKRGGFRAQLFVADDGPGITVATGPVRRTEGAAARDGVQLFAGQHVAGTEWDDDGWREAIRRVTRPPSIRVEERPIGLLAHDRIHQPQPKRKTR